MDKILTISVGAYNAENWLRRCIDSIVGTKHHSKLEIVIVNDGSSDGTLSIATDYAERYPDCIKVVNKPNGGYGSTINTSIELATGRYFKTIDSDDWVETENLDRLIEDLCTSEVDIVLNPYYVISTSDMSKELSVPHTLSGEYASSVTDFDAAAAHLLMPMHAITYRTDIIKKVGPVLSNRYYADGEYTIYPIRYLNTIRVLGFPVYDYVVGVPGQSINKSTMQKCRDQQLDVLHRIVHYYEGLSDLISAPKIELIRKWAGRQLMLQYFIYLRMRPEESRIEIIEYDRWLKSTSPDLYDAALMQGKRMGSGYMKLIGILRRTSFRGYTPAVRLLTALKILS